MSEPEFRCPDCEGREKYIKKLEAEVDRLLVEMAGNGELLAHIANRLNAEGFLGFGEVDRAISALLGKIKRLEGDR